jgi:hypothetical protein
MFAGTQVNPVMDQVFEFQRGGTIRLWENDQAPNPDENIGVGVNVGFRSLVHDFDAVFVNNDAYYVLYYDVIA